MSQTIDKRVVEMRFDNKQFESGAKETMSTLDRLKAALKLPDSEKALDGLGRAAKNVKLDGISSGIDALEKRFSTFGIVGMRVIENITDGLMGKLHSAVSFVTDSIVSGGVKRAMNIENAHFQLQALLKDETKVQAVMADAMESVDGTAYAYDEAAKAASQFAASGIQAGDEMLGSLKGITGVAAMTNSSFEDISRIFTTVAGNGRLMGDQLLQLSSRGLNAASTLADYFREVRGQSGMTEAAIREMVSDGEISFKDFAEAMTWAFGDSAKRANETFTGALSNMKSALARIGAGFISPLVEQNGEVVQLFNALRIKINDVKSALVFDEQRSAISGLADVTKMSKDELEGMFKTIKSNGKVSISDLDTLSKKGADATSALTKYINGVADGSIRANYAITSSVKSLTNGTKVSTEDVRKFVEEGKIDLATFTSAMEKEFGTEKTLSKQFTDWFLDYIHTIVDAVNSFDVSKPMEIFYHWVEIVKNGVKGLLSVIKPIGKAFSSVFLNFSLDDVASFSEVLEKLTSKMTLSSRNSRNLQDAFKGLFSVVKLVLDGFLNLLKALLPLNAPLITLGDKILVFAGQMGRSLVSFTNMIRSCDLLKKAFSVLQTGISSGADALTKMIKIAHEFVIRLSRMEGTTKLIEAVSNAFGKLGAKATPYIENFVNEANEFLKTMFNLDNINLDNVLNTISNAFSRLAYEIDNFSFKTLEDAFDRFKDKFREFGDLLMSNEGFATFVTNFKKYGEELRDAFTLDNLLDRLEKVMDVFGRFFNFVKETMGPAFKDFNFAEAGAAAGGFGIIYAMIKASKAIENVSKSIKSVPDLLGGIRGTLVAYQKDLKADAIIKIAGAIAILAGALTLLSFADTDRLMSASIALSLIAGTLMFGISKLLDATKKGEELNSSLKILSKGLSSTMKKFGTAMEIKAVGGAVKKFAESVAIIAASIIALGYMYNKDKDALMAGVDLVKWIGLALTGIMAGMSILGNVMKGNGMKNFSKAALGILSLSLSLTLVVGTLNKLFKMDFPPDWEFKLSVLAGILAGFSVLAVSLGLASRIAGKNKISSTSILSMAVLLLTTVTALNKLFKMDFPSDWQEKLTILGLIFAGFGALMLTMGVASRLAGGSMKAAGTILAMCVFIGTIVAALVVLTTIPVDKMLYGATTLGIILTTLGIALYGAGKITAKDTHKSVLAMAVVVGAITASLAVLAMVPFSKLLKGVVTLGSILLILAEDFKQASKISNENSWMGILAMIAAVLSISYSLYTLAEQPWSKLLAAAVSMSAVLLAFAKTFEMISKSDGISVEKIGLFLAATTAVIPIGVALYELSMQPWTSMLASGASMTAVILAFAQAFKMISKTDGINIEKIGLFLLATTAVIPIGLALYELAQQPWGNLLAAGVSLSATIITFAGAFKIISSTNPNLAAIGTFLAASVSVGLIALSIYELSKQPWKNLLASAASLSLVLVAMSAAMALCSAAGAVASAAIAGILLLDLFIANFALVLIALGALFQTSGARQLMSGGAKILVQIGQAIGEFVGAIIGGALSGITASLPRMATDLSSFMTNLQPFISGSKNIDAKALACVGFLVGIVLALSAAEIINGIRRLFGISLVDTAEELSSFMTALQPFISQSKQLKEDSMRACENLASMIITLTKAELIAGISRFLGVGGSIAQFGEELASFGPHIKKFANDVKDVRAEAVQGAASAAEIMANLANKLPGTGGLSQKIFGERSISQFGEELVKFGPNIKKFGDTVKDVNAAQVQGAASAAEIMANLATKLPPQGGLAQKIFGERSISQFGEELVKFGPKISQFAGQVKNVNPEAVTGAASAATIMSDLANNLPNGATLFSKIFGGGQATLSQFGEELVKFGTEMSRFAASVSGIDPAIISKAVTGFKDIMDLATYGKGISATDLVNFSNQLGQIGSDAVDRFVLAFKNAGPKATKAVNTLITAVNSAMTSGGKTVQSNAVVVGSNMCVGLQTGMNAKQSVVLSTVSNICTSIVNKFKTGLPQSTFNTIGLNVMQGLINGMNSKKALALSTVGNICTSIINKFKTGLPQSTFNTIGQTVVQGLINGMNSKKTAAVNAAGSICTAIIDKFKSDLKESTLNSIGQNMINGLINGMNSQSGAAQTAAINISNSVINAFRNTLTQSVMYDIGAYAALGLKYGIESKINEIANAAIAAAKAAVNSAKSTLKTASPSKVMIEVGEFFSMGLANGIINQLRAISLSGTKAAEEAINPVQRAVDGISSIIDSGNFDIDPVIRPVVDLSNVQKGVQEISSLLNRSYDLSSVYNKVMDTSSSFDRTKKTISDRKASTAENGGGDTFNFNQVINSPKPLSRSEIYRQTNNQFSAFKRVVSNA